MFSYKTNGKLSFLRIGRVNIQYSLSKEAKLSCRKFGGIRFIKIGKLALQVSVSDTAENKYNAACEKRVRLLMKGI